MTKTNPKTRPAWVTSVSIAIPIDPKDPQQAVAAKAAVEAVLKSLPPGAVAEITRASFGRMEAHRQITDEELELTEEELLNALKADAPRPTGIAEESMLNAGASFEKATETAEEPEIPEHMRRLPRARGG